MARQEKVFGPGEIIAERYEIIEELGRGSYGVVFRALQLGIGRVVAVKTLLPQMAVDSEEHQRFEREALLISRLNHPNIITLFDYGKHEGVLFMVMEYVEGRTLGELIENDAPLAPELARRLVYQMLEALQYAHDQGVVHRDLKPENIQLLKSASMGATESESLKILDFGIAKFVQGENDGSPLDTLTQTGIALGTPQYMSPENITGDPVSHHADLYAVGLILYEMLTGEAAFTGVNPHMVMVSHIKDDPPRLPEEAHFRSFDRALEWALRKQPDERVPSARAFREVLEEDAGLLAAPAAPSKAGLWKPALAVLVAATLVIVLLLVALFQEGAQETTQLPERETREGDVAQAESSPAVRDDTAEEWLDFSIEEVDEDEAEYAQHDEAEEMEEADEESPRASRAAERDAVGAVTRRGGPGQEQAERERSPTPESVKLRIVTVPESARITVNGSPVGLSPLIREVPRGEGNLELGFSLIGYRDTVVQVVPDKDQTVEVRLERGRLDL